MSEREGPKLNITEVRVKLVEGGRQEKLKAFCSITIDDAFVIRDLKIIEGTKGLFVAMPSRKLTVRCPKCGSKNQVRSNYCAECGKGLPADRTPRGRDGRMKLHADIAHPIHSECREAIQSRVLEDFHGECVAAEEPDYRPVSDEDFEDYGAEIDDVDPRPVRTAGRDSTRRTPSPRESSPEATDPFQIDRRLSDRGRRDLPQNDRPRNPAQRDQAARDNSREVTSREAPVRKRLAHEEVGGPASNSSDPPPDDNFDAGIF